MSSGNAGYTEKELLRMIRKWVPRDRVPKRVRVKDTSDFFRVDYDDVVILDDVPYFVRNNEREGRFGLEDEQKFWVKRASNLLTGEVKILKWVFRERFEARIGNLVFECVRSPQKEARILELVRGRPDFMQGKTVLDSSGQPAPDPGLYQGQNAGPDHARTGQEPRGFFLSTTFPRCSTSLSASSRPSASCTSTTRSTAISGGTISSRTWRPGRYRWIDFDFNYRHGESRFGFDLFGLGNVLLFITGRGDITTYRLLPGAARRP